jgi:carboxyl-terminal processing protease
VKRKVTALLSLLAAFLLFAGGFFNFQLHLQAEGFSKEKLLAQVIRTGLQRWHYSTGRVNDQAFSDKVFNEFLKYMDPSKRFFLKSDIDELQKYDDRIDKQFALGNTVLMEKAMKLLDTRIHQVMDFYQELLAKPFDFTIQETLELDPEKRDFCANPEELKEYWRKTLKYRALMRYISFVEQKDQKKSREELEKEARQWVLKSFKSIFNRLLQDNANDSLSYYLNAFIKVYDPHSNYFLPVDKESYDMEMSGSFEGIGALLGNEDEYVKVIRIIPGGPSWRGKQLEAGDLILKAAQGDEEPEDIIGMRTVDAVKLIRGKKGTLVRLTVKKPDGRIVEIPIVRDVVILEETFARSAILVHKKTGKHFGYISVPLFYNSFTRGGRNSTDDVEKELEKLKSKQVEGIILDLRNNGGGALIDGVGMSGLFIPRGPIVQVKDNDNHIEVLNDPTPTAVFKGPLIVMVNQLSASSSEILAAALQDYNRALIVGSSHSYGKGTVQGMVNLDEFIPEKREKYDAYGALTITIRKFYRVTGQAIQQKGVTPDIVLPDPYDSFEIGEKYLDYSLEWDTIPASDFQEWSPEPLAAPDLVDKSKTRVRENPAFKQIKEYSEKVKQMREQTLQSLQADQVIKRQNQLKEEREKLEKSQKESTHIEVLPSAEPEKQLSERMSKVTLEQQRQWFKDIKKDIFLEEVVEILDYMSRTTKEKGNRQEKRNDE